MLAAKELRAGMDSLFVLSFIGYAIEAKKNKAKIKMANKN